MRNAILLALVALGTTMVIRETSRRRVKRREAEEREEIGRWESEGGSLPDPKRKPLAAVSA